jgi:hypothetical protein
VFGRLAEGSPFSEVECSDLANTHRLWMNSLSNEYEYYLSSRSVAREGHIETWHSRMNGNVYIRQNLEIHLSLMISVVIVIWCKASYVWSFNNLMFS